jgi:hypothetical protein
MCFNPSARSRPVHAGDLLDLSCRLTEMIQTQKGIESKFALDIPSQRPASLAGNECILDKKPADKKKVTSGTRPGSP